MKKQKTNTSNETVVYFDKWPKAKDLFTQNSLLVYDKSLIKNSEIKKLINLFDMSIPVSAGESLKNMDSLQKLMNQAQILADKKGSSIECVYSLGGGSIGDFVGFFASIWKRGVGLFHIPTTWLAAIDSAHGGKNALNLNKAKNQIGSFYFPDNVLIIKPLLMAQPEERIFESLGEVMKMALIQGGSLVDKFESSKKITAKELWEMLPFIISSKYAIVDIDPFEEIGVRHVLNLGHTVGHIFESYFSIPHGVAVAMGLEFVIHWSVYRQLLKGKELEKLMFSSLWLKWDEAHAISKYKSIHYEQVIQIPEKEFVSLLTKDKKRNGVNSMNFVFIEGFGKSRVESVSFEEIVKEYNRQKKYFYESI